MQANDPFHEDGDPWFYYGLYSLADSRSVDDLLKSLGAEYFFSSAEETEEMLRNWAAWDSNAENPFIAHHLWVHQRHVDFLGARITELLVTLKTAQ